MKPAVSAPNAEGDENAGSIRLLRIKLFSNETIFE